MIDRFSPLGTDSRFLVLYGANTSDIFCSSSLQILSIEQALNEYLKGRGFNRIIYFSETQKLYFWDLESRDRFLPATATQQKAKPLIKAGPMGTKTALLSKSKPATPNQSSIPPIARLRDIQCLSFFETAMCGNEQRSALVFPYAEELRSFDNSRELLERIARWSRLPPTNENLCVFIFQQENLESLSQFCSQHLSPVLLRSTPQHISHPSAAEINNLMQWFRIERNYSVNWQDLQILPQQLTDRGLPLKHWYQQFKSDPTFSLDVATQNDWLGVAQATPTESIESLLDELDTYVGLESVKASIRELVHVEIANELLKEDGFEDEGQSRHMIYLGNPGTGKTTIANLLGRIYKAAGLLRSGHFVEADREKLVSGYVGQTAIKTTEVINAALDGVLFIDEAYALARGGENDFGREAIDTLVPAMESYRDRLVVILAGYSEEMQSFIDANPGIRSRVPDQYQIEFPDYSASDLLEIFLRFCAKGKRICPDGVQDSLALYFDRMWQNRDKNFGNGREVRNTYEQMVRRQKVRMVREKLTGDDRSTFTEEDIPR